MKIKTVFDFNKALSIGPYAWPGGYPFYFVCSDGESIAFKVAEKEASLIRDSVISQDDTGGWLVVAMEINWEGANMYCVQSGQKIESAYGGD